MKKIYDSPELELDMIPDVVTTSGELAEGDEYSETQKLSFLGLLNR